MFVVFPLLFFPVTEKKYLLSFLLQASNDANVVSFRFVSFHLQATKELWTRLSAMNLLATEKLLMINLVTILQICALCSRQSQ